MKRRAIFAGKLTRTQPAACLDCGKVLDSATGLGHKSRPKPGDISICFDCGHLQAYDWNLQFRPLTDEEMVDIAGDPVIVAAQKARGEVLKGRE